uniref:Uncharacterized protein n=1 Tax=Cyclopterus lumpus TaxID=8103 RepID=A0A8C3AX57_CYCLU
HKLTPSLLVKSNGVDASVRVFGSLSPSSPPQLYFRCFSSLSALLPPSPCRLLGGLLRNILSSPLRASLR